MMYVFEFKQSPTMVLLLCLLAGMVCNGMVFLGWAGFWFRSGGARTFFKQRHFTRAA